MDYDLQIRARPLLKTVVFSVGLLRQVADMSIPAKLMETITNVLAGNLDLFPGMNDADNQQPWSHQRLEVP